jgi:carboxymethylenebutenolidase
MSRPTLVSLTPLLFLGWALSARGAEPAHEHGGDAGVTMASEPHPLDPNPPKPQGSMITLLQPGGVSAQAYVARPKQGVRGAILVIHEWWGLNDWVKAQADAFANQGYLALAVDLYGGKVATTREEAVKLVQGFDPSHGAAVETAGVQWLRQAAPGKKLATIGWCFGGGQSLLASLNNAPDVSATVIYYGMPVTDVARLKTLRGPVLGIWGKKDGSITPDKVAAFDKALTEAGVKHSFHSFDANHAFANPSGGAYNPPAAEEANALTKKFLADTLRP